MKKQYTQPEARAAINQLLTDMVSLSQNGFDPSLDEAASLTLEARIDDYLNNTNIPLFDWEYSVLIKLKFIFSARHNAAEDTTTANDIHFMSGNDILPSIVFVYDQDLDYMTDLMKDNRVYSTDEALEKGILRVRGKQ